MSSMGTTPSARCLAPRATSSPPLKSPRCLARCVALSSMRQDLTVDCIEYATQYVSCCQCRHWQR